MIARSEGMKKLPTVVLSVILHRAYLVLHGLVEHSFGR